MLIISIGCLTQTRQTESQLYSVTSAYKVSEYSLVSALFYFVYIGIATYLPTNLPTYRQKVLVHLGVPTFSGQFLLQ